jgi:hypothetical protein
MITCLIRHEIDGLYMHHEETTRKRKVKSISLYYIWNQISDISLKSFIINKDVSMFVDAPPAS